MAVCDMVGCRVILKLADGLMREGVLRWTLSQGYYVENEEGVVAQFGGLCETLRTIIYVPCNLGGDCTRATGGRAF